MLTGAIKDDNGGRNGAGGVIKLERMILGALATACLALLTLGVNNITKQFESFQTTTTKQIDNHQIQIQKQLEGIVAGQSDIHRELKKFCADLAVVQTRQQERIDRELRDKTYRGR